MKAVYALAFCGLLSFAVSAQSRKPITIEALYQQALQFYAEDNFKGCLTKIDRAETLSSKANARLLYLKTKALVQLCQTDNLYCAGLADAYPSFLKVAASQNYPPSKIDEIKKLEPLLQQLTIAKTTGIRRLALSKDSLRVVAEQTGKLNAVYDRVMASYQNNDWRRCLTTLSEAEGLPTRLVPKLLALKIRVLYNLFQQSPATYQTVLGTAFSEFEPIASVSEQRDEIRELQSQFNEQIQQIAQQTARKAKIAQLYQQAEGFYEDDKLTDCLASLKELETVAGTPTPKTLYLKIKVLSALSEQDMSNKSELEYAMSRYIQLTETQTSPALKVAEVKSIQSYWRTR